MRRVADWLVVGMGLTGAVIASQIARKLGQRVVIVDRRPHLGGNAYDCYDASGVLIQKYGAHIFHTNSRKVAEFLSAFTGWLPYEHRVLALVGEQFVPVPFNLTSMEMVFGQSAGGKLNKLLTDEFGMEVKVPILKMRDSQSAEIRNVADFIYEKIFLHYTVKQWGLRPEELDASVAGRVPIFLSRDGRYFQDSFQKMPKAGFSGMIARMLAHANIEVRTGVAFPQGVEAIRFNQMVFTGPIDEFFSAIHGELPYRSLRFEFETTQSPELIQQAGVHNYPTPASEHPYTRVIEFRHFTGQLEAPATTRAFEYPEAYRRGENEPYYSIHREESRLLYLKYAEMAKKLGTVIFVGRLADYAYYNMDQAVGRALTCFEREIAPRAGKMRCWPKSAAPLRNAVHGGKKTRAIKVL
jgi:UDP-galactopyranose mutase